MRRPFLLALACLVIGLSAWAAVPALGRAWRQHQEDRREAAWVARLTPAWRALAAMPDPPGLTGWPLNHSDRFHLFFAWHGHVGPHQAALRLRSALVHMGASHAQVRCRTLTARPFTLCGVGANLAGVPLSANVGPGISSSGAIEESSTDVEMDLGLASPLTGG